jgi:uncharacterized membrane protein YqiK
MCKTMESIGISMFLIVIIIISIIVIIIIITNRVLRCVKQLS